MDALLGETVQGKSGDVAVSSFAQEGSVVGLYFSAHWCPPCRGFTPKLAKWYENFKKTPNGSKLEIVFISSDRDEGSFNEYYGEMPWLALPYSKRSEKEKLSKKFKVQGIPTFVLLEADTGKILTKNGRNIVDSDPKGANFPWRPKPLRDMLVGTVKTKEGEKDLAEAISGKVLGIYFSAHWCPPCRGFTPKLIETYKKVKDAGKKLEVLFVSSDRDETQFEDYYKDMPWLALPYDDEDPRKEELNAHFEVSGIPQLVILDENLEVIAKDGRGAISSDPNGEKFPWIPQPLQELSPEMADSLNESPCLVYFTDQKEDLIAQAQLLLQEVATETVAAVKASNGEKDPIVFTYESKESEDLPQSLRSFVGIEKSAPCLVYLNISAQEKHICEQENLTKEDVRQMVAKIHSGTMEATPLRE